MVTVHVVVPCFNYGHYLDECVASVLRQDGVDVNILIIDDASSDGSQDVCRKIESSDSRVSLIAHKKNMGHIATYNEGLSLASSEYVVLLSADDLLTPGALRRATAIMEINPSVGFVYGHPLTFSALPLPTPRIGRSTSTTWTGREWIDLMCMTGRNFICCPEVVMRTSIQQRIGLYNTALPHSADMEMWMRAASVANVGRVNGADQAYYRVHKHSMQRTIHSGYVYDLRGRYLAFQSVFGADTEFPGADKMLAKAAEALALSAIRRSFQVLSSARGSIELIDELCRFAKEICPDIEFTKAWRRLQAARTRTGIGSIFTSLAEATSDLKEGFGWRRWRRTGINWSR